MQLSNMQLSDMFCIWLNITGGRATGVGFMSFVQNPSDLTNISYTVNRSPKL